MTQNRTYDPNAPQPEQQPSEGMRFLDEAAGGGEVPIGPLGGPTPKTRERLLAEQEVKDEAADRAAIDAAKEEVRAEARTEITADSPLA